MKHVIISWLGLALWLTCQNALAMILPELYTASVPVKGRNIPMREAAFKQGLTDVLIKLSGNNTVPRSQAGQDAIGLASRYAVGYQYEKRKKSKLLVQKMQFDVVAVNQLLQQLQLPLWEGERSTFLTWLLLLKEGEALESDNDMGLTDYDPDMLDENDTFPSFDATREITEADEEALIERLTHLHDSAQQPAAATPFHFDETAYTILNPQNNAKEASVLQQLSAQRGVSMLMPLLEPQDAQLLALEQLQQHDISAFNAVASRYATDTVLAAVLQKHALSPPEEPKMIETVPVETAPIELDSEKKRAASPLPLEPEMFEHRPIDKKIPTEKWQAQWYLLHQQQVLTQQSEANDFPTLLAQGADWAIQQIAPQADPTPAQEKPKAVTEKTVESDNTETPVETVTMNITVNHVTRLQQFGRLKAQLEQLPAVMSVEILQLQTQQMHLKLNVAKNQTQDIARVLDSLPTLQLEQGASGELTYRYISQTIQGF